MIISNYLCTVMIPDDKVFSISGTIRSVRPEYSGTRPLM